MFQIIPLKNLTPSPNNYRKSYDPDKLAELTASVKAKGILEPILVRPLKKKDKYEVVAGSRRYQAAQGAGLTEVPAIVKELTDEEALEIQIVENSQREDPNPMEEAWGFKRLLDMGKHTPETLSERLDRSVTYVLGRLKLVDLDKKVQDAIASGTIGSGHALLFTRLRNAEDQKKFLDDIIEHEYSVRYAKDMIGRLYSNEIKDAPFDTSDCATCAFRSRNQTVLFPDLNQKDECTDKACFYEKSKAHYEAVLDEKERQGFPVFRDAKEVTALTDWNAKNSKRIIAPGEEHGYGTEVPKKYYTECDMCGDHHAYYFYEANGYSGKRLEFGEICLNKKCLDAMQKAGKKEEEKTRGEQHEPAEEVTSPHVKQYNAKECLRRFLVWDITPMMGDIIRKRLMLTMWLEQFYEDETREALLQLFWPAYKEGEHYSDFSKIYTGVSNIPVDRLDEAIKKAIDPTIGQTGVETLLQIAPDVGVDIENDFRIDREWLETKTKKELLELIGDIRFPGVIGIRKNSKEDTIINAILAKDLTGIIPPEIAEVIKGEEEEESGEEEGGTFDVDGEMSCIGCGCSVSFACEGSCHWLAKNDSTNKGVCSECPDELEKIREKEGWIVLDLSMGDRKAEMPEPTETAPEDDPTMPKATKVKIKRGKK